jgi:hypothetical protein
LKSKINLLKNRECEAHVTISPRTMKEVPHVITVKGLIHMGDRKWGKFCPEIDNGCQITCISPRLVRKFGLKRTKLNTPIPMTNADGMLNKQKEATHIAKLTMKIDSH